MKRIGLGLLVLLVAVALGVGSCLGTESGNPSSMGPTGWLGGGSGGLGAGGLGAGGFGAGTWGLPTGGAGALGGSGGTSAEVPDAGADAGDASDDDAGG